MMNVRGGFVFVMLAACSQPQPPDAREAPSASNAPVIATFATQSGKVSVLGGTGGRDLRVVIVSNDGSVVANGITLAELRTRNREVYELVTTAVASESGSRGAFLDARGGPPESVRHERAP